MSIANMDISVIRKGKGLSQADLADIVGVDRTLVSHIERGVATPSVKVAKALASTLGIDWTRFFDEPEQTPPDEATNIDGETAGSSRNGKRGVTP